MTTLFAALLALFGRATAAKQLDGVVNLNTAPPDVLTLLPGVGPSKASAIVAYRRKHPFRVPDELVRIKGIGRKMVRRLRAHLAVSGPTTARAISASAPAAAAPPPPAVPPRAPPARVATARWQPGARSPPKVLAFPRAPRHWANACGSAP